MSAMVSAATYSRVLAERDAAQAQADALRKERDELEAALRGAETAMAENEAYQNAIDASDKRAKECADEGDMFGWNFHKGVSSGFINRSISQGWCAQVYPRSPRRRPFQHRPAPRRASASQRAR